MTLTSPGTLTYSVAEQSCMSPSRLVRCSQEVAIISRFALAKFGPVHMAAVIAGPGYASPLLHVHLRRRCLAAGLRTTEVSFVPPSRCIVIAKHLVPARHSPGSSRAAG